MLSEKDNYSFLNHHPYYGDNGKIRNFVILTYPRTGSHYLIFRLRSSGIIAGYGELFHTRKTFKTLYPDFALNEVAAEYRNNNPEKFIEYIFSNYNESIKAAGFKINYNQEDLFKEVNLLDLLSDKFNVRWIHLKRRNCLKSYISLKLMQQTNICFAVKPEVAHLFIKNTNRIIGLDELNSYKPVIKVNVYDMMNHIHELEQNSKDYDKRLQKFSHIDLFYEDFADDLTNTISSVSEFLLDDPLAIRQNDVSSDPIVKLNTRPLKQVISNYDEVSSVIKNYGHEEWLEE